MSIQDLYGKPILLQDFRNHIGDIISPSKEDEVKAEPPSTTNIIVTKYEDSTPDMLDVEPALELDNKGKIIEVELLPSGHLRNIQNKSHLSSINILNKTVIKKVTKRKVDGTEQKKVWEQGKKKRIKHCSVCGKEYVKNHELFCKPDSENLNSEENLVCTVCRKEFPNVTVLKRHTASCRLHSLNSALCSKCGKHFSSNYNLKRHMTSCKLCPDVEKSPRYMCQCGRTYAQEWDMKKHKVKCKDAKKKCKHCLIANCNLLFYHKAQLIAHMKKDHNMSIQDPVVLNFNSFDEFLQWKEKEEEDTYTYYSKQTGSNVSGVSVNTYYVCQHDGSDRTHTSAPRKTGRRNKKGRIKTGTLCWSQMNVKQFKDGTVRVTYFPSHTHPISISDTEHHPLPSSITMEIKRRLSEITNETEEPQENPELKKGRRKRYGMTLRALRALARKNRSLFRITAEAIEKDKVEPDEKGNIQFTPKFISSDENNLMQVFVTDNDDVDDPDELPPEQLNESKEENLLEDCMNHVNELKTFLESGKLDTFQMSHISETLKNLVNKCKEEQQQQQQQQQEEQQQEQQQQMQSQSELSVTENAVIDSENQSIIMPSCQVMMSSSPLSSTEIFPMQDDVNMNNAELNDELKQLGISQEKAIYQIIPIDGEEKQSNELFCHNAVELVGDRFIIIQGELFQSVDSNTQFDLT